MADPQLCGRHGSQAHHIDHGGGAEVSSPLLSAAPSRRRVRRVAAPRGVVSLEAVRFSLDTSRWSADLLVRARTSHLVKCHNAGYC